MLFYSLGAKLPPPTAGPNEMNSSKPAGHNEKPPINEENLEPEEKLELDMSGVIKGEEDEPLPMGDNNKEVMILDIYGC